MKMLLPAVLISCVLGAPTLACAQATDAPITRAEVSADLIRVEQAGYNPASSDLYYPADIQAAEAKVAAHDGSPAAQATGGVALSGASQAGAALAMNDTASIYAHP
ncbi:DUF4148 domain-containing protein [Paraburkholderia pallida]|uniref:DUF4148 domain-containing protein n=1 Tax=Paraburkholderia pallida TaxID=2547399 RepID=A0A4P7CZ29_9BURK|nr:DUF4148 domain-containing protein [Paraburkholderia pallida]QBR01591.1 DUF4148 domain-containing protein [Paraburkholderia pallida]